MGQGTLGTSLARGCQTDATCPLRLDRLDSPAPPTRSGLALRGRPASLSLAPGVEAVAPWPAHGHTSCIGLFFPHVAHSSQCDLVYRKVNSAGGRWLFLLEINSGFL